MLPGLRAEGHGLGQKYDQKRVGGASVVAEAPENRSSSYRSNSFWIWDRSSFRLHSLNVAITTTYYAGKMHSRIRVRRKQVPKTEKEIV